MANPYFNLINPIFQPSLRIVESITTTNPAIVTTTLPHLYISGTVVRIDVPLGFGMPQINQQIGTIYVTSPTTFTLSLDATQFDPLLAFASWPARASSYPLSSAIGEDNSILTAAMHNTLERGASV